MTHLLTTLTLNPALDLAAQADSVVPTHKVRMHNEHADPGGGGVNVARVLHELGANALAIVAAGGATGRVLEEMLDDAGVQRQSVPVKGQTRVSLNVLDCSAGLEYRFVPEGPTLSEGEFHAFLAAVEAAEGKWLIASGSLPHGVPDDAYARMAHIAARKGQLFVLDTSGVALRAALEQGGLELVKPSLGELEHLVGRAPAGPRRAGFGGHETGAQRSVAAGRGHPRLRRRGAGHAGRRGTAAGNGRCHAQLGRRGRCIPRRGDARPVAWRHSGGCAGLGHRRRCDCHCLCRHRAAAP